MTSFPTPYQEFIYTRTYARWREEDKRRETWDETVDRYFKFFLNRLKGKNLNTLQAATFGKAIEAIRQLEVMPSMRSLWTAGEALDRENIAGYNCAYTVIDNPKAFAEILYILMNGTGVGFSVERQYINQLPEVPDLSEDRTLTRNEIDVFHNHTHYGRIVFQDSKLGWAEGYYDLLLCLYAKVIPTLDYSLIRPKGSRLKTFGGRASGHEPLKELCEFTIETFKKAQGRKLNSLECYDLVCMIANCVVVGGVRRSATINLSNFSDQRLRHAKDGQFWIDNPQRQLSNNSVAYTEKPDTVAFMEEWLNLARSGSGERGIVNREGLKKTAVNVGRTPADFGVNPCGEIILRPKQFCNLSEVVIRPHVTLETLKEKVIYATILGTLQSTLSDFQFLSDEWRKNTEEERLLGVSLTGLADHPRLNGTRSSDSQLLEQTLKECREVAYETNLEWSEILGIRPAASITCVKPSGTVSQLVDAASGIHPRHSRFYIRRVRVNTSDPICRYLESVGVTWNPEVGQEVGECNTKVFDFPMAAPAEDVVLRNQRTAIQQLEYWLTLKTFWCDHNPSATIYVKDEEWLEVGAWVFKHWDSIGGLSFLPYDGGHYRLAPYEEINEETYWTLFNSFPKLDFTRLSTFEAVDQTQGSREFACQGGVCELV